MSENELSDSTIVHDYLKDIVIKKPLRVLYMYTHVSIFDIIFKHYSYDAKSFYLKENNPRINIHKSCFVYGLAGAQDSYDKVYVDDVELYPNNECEGLCGKEVRYAHNLSRLFRAASATICDYDRVQLGAMRADIVKTLSKKSGAMALNMDYDEHTGKFAECEEDD